MVTGVVALMLEANPALTWREVKYILATTARKIDFVDPDPLTVYGTLSHPDGVTDYTPYVYDYKWVQNDAGHWFSNWYGFGLVDAEAAVTAAKSWVSGSLGTYTNTEVSDASVVAITDADMSSPGQASIAVPTNLTIESVRVLVNLTHPYPEQLAVHLISPAGTVSRLVLVDSGITSGGSNSYHFLSNAFLDESSSGTWKIEVYDPSDLPDYDDPADLDPDDGIDQITVNDTGNINGWTITIYGH
jgi:subtilisin-like proprotein convertase family protein